MSFVFDNVLNLCPHHSSRHEDGGRSHMEHKNTSNDGHVKIEDRLFKAVNGIITTGKDINTSGHRRTDTGDHISSNLYILLFYFSLEQFLLYKCHSLPLLYNQRGVPFDMFVFALGFPCQGCTNIYIYIYICISFAPHQRETK